MTHDTNGYVAHRTLPNVLPSPAPSDEPSPAALPNYKDSPSSQTVSLAAASQGRPITASTSAQEPVPEFSMRANPDPEVVPPNANGATRTSPEQAVLGALSQAAMPPPDLPSSTESGPFRGGAIVAESCPDLGPWPNSTGVQEHSNKRRRVELVKCRDSGLIGFGANPRDLSISTGVAMAELAAAVDMRIAQLGGIDNLSPEVEGPRLLLLRDACAKGDVLYLHLHSLYCLWSCNPQSLPAILSRDLDTVHRGFSIVETVLSPNSGFRQDNLMWYAAFPRKGFNEDNPEGVKQVAGLLAGLSQYWSTLSSAVSTRNYPFLVDELLGQLQCYSVSMQDVLFTAYRRRLGIQDGTLVGQQVHSLFRLDQKQHMDEQGSFRPVVLSNDPEDVERRNLILIRAYRDFWSKARAVQEPGDQNPQRRQEEYRRQAVAAQQVAQQQLQWQQLQRAHTLIQQQQMRNNQARLISQPTVQVQNQFQLAQLQAQVYQGQQQQSNPHWAQGQMESALTGHARRPSENAHLQIARPAVQLNALPQSSGAYPAAASPTVPQHSFSPRLNHLPHNIILSSNIPSSPNMPGSTQAQYQYSNPQQQQQPAQAHNQTHTGPWPASTPSPTFARSPQMPNGRTTNPSISNQMSGQQAWSLPPSRESIQVPSLQPLVIQQQLAQQQLAQQQLAQQQMRRQMGQQQPGQLQVGQQMVPQTMQLNHRLIPRPGHVIDRSEHPHSQQERKSLLMSLHQAHARSPERTRSNGDADERYYQSVHSLAVQPLRLIYYHEVNFEVSPEQFTRLCKPKTLPQLSSQKQTRVPLPVREYGNGSLRFRVRCCRLPPEKVPIQESDWVTKDMSWPEHIFVHVNEQKLTIRRATHYGKDLPIELTDFLLAGTNRLRVAFPRAGPTATDKGGKMFFFAVEIIEMSSHAMLLTNIGEENRADREETLEKIRKRVNAAPDEDDEIAVIDCTGSTARDLSIGLTDPFSASIFRTPTRGATCTHLECFDLETWLSTRPIKQQIKCGHKDVCTCPKRLEPTDPDKWKCPICFEDARPCSLRIDSFLEDVRKQLEERDQLNIKSILVAADGSWRPVDEPKEEEEEEGSDGDVPASATRRSASAVQKSAGPSNHLGPVERGRVPVEVIELD